MNRTEASGFSAQQDHKTCEAFWNPVLRARVEKGRLVLDEPTTLPVGTVVDLVVGDEGDDLTDEERRALHDTLSASRRSAEAGRLRKATDILDELRRRRDPSRSNHT